MKSIEDVLQFLNAKNGTLVSAESETETKLPIPVFAENKNGPKLANLQVRQPKTKFGLSLVYSSLPLFIYLCSL